MWDTASPRAMNEDKVTAYYKGIIKVLEDQIADLKDQLREAQKNKKPEDPPRRPADLGTMW